MLSSSIITREVTQFLVCYSAGSSSSLPQLRDRMERFQCVSDNRLLDLQQPINDVLDIVVATLSILPKVEAVDVGHVERFVLRIVVMNVYDGFSLIDGNREDNGIATRSSSCRIDLVEYPH